MCAKNTWFAKTFPSSAMAGQTADYVANGGAIDDSAKSYANDPGKAPDAPDITDETVRKARARRMLQLMMGRGRAQSFLTGPSAFNPNATSSPGGFGLGG